MKLKKKYEELEKKGNQLRNHSRKWSLVFKTH